jgi:hypothetical protein
MNYNLCYNFTNKLITHFLITKYNILDHIIVNNYIKKNNFIEVVLNYIIHCIIFNKYNFNKHINLIDFMVLNNYYHFHILFNILITISEIIQLFSLDYKKMQIL